VEKKARAACMTPERSITTSLAERFRERRHGGRTAIHPGATKRSIFTQFFPDGNSDTRLFAALINRDLFSYNNHLYLH
jgi:hypothetical protein